VTAFNGLDRSRTVSLSQHVAATLFGVLMALIWLAALACVVWYPRVAAGLFLLAGVVGLVGVVTTEVRDLLLWAGLSGALAVSSYLGYRGKRSQQREEYAEAAAERTRQLRKAQQLEADRMARAARERAQGEPVAQAGPAGSSDEEAGDQAVGMPADDGDIVVHDAEDTGSVGRGTGWPG